MYMYSYILILQTQIFIVSVHLQVSPDVLQGLYYISQGNFIILSCADHNKYVKDFHNGLLVGNHY